MNTLRTTLTVALAAVVLIGTGAVAGGVAATPGPDNAGPENGSSDAGPPSDLPDQVPDFVGNILDSVNEFLGGGVDDLGETVSDIAGDGTGENDTNESDGGSS